MKMQMEPDLSSHIELVTFLWYFQPRYVLRVSPPSKIHVRFKPLLAQLLLFPFFSYPVKPLMVTSAR